MYKPYRTLIIDDELLARERIEGMLLNFPDDIKVIGQCVNGKQALVAINELKPDLIFLDIEMPLLTGFQLINKLEHIPLIVFCTAYDNYALKAFETNSVDYLVKPLQLERLHTTIKKLRRFNNTNAAQNILEAVKSLTQNTEAKAKTSITVKTGDRLIFIKLEDIFYFEASSKCVTIFAKKNHYITDRSLVKLEHQLPSYFLRVHRSIIMNTNMVLDVKKYFNNRYVITLTDSKRTNITTGRSYIDSVKKWINL